jgi:PAS domain S-box-containing protein
LPQPLSGTDIVAFTLGVIAVMQFIVWLRDREPGLLWLAAAFSLDVVLAAFDDALRPIGRSPQRAYLLINLVVHCCYSFGLVYYLGVARRWQPWAIGALTAPVLLAAFAVLAGVPLEHGLVMLPMVVTGLGFALLCLHAARREPGAGHELLALGSLAGPACVLLARWRGADLVQMHYYAWPAAISFGVALLVASLMRRRRETHVSQARAQRMADFYQAISHTDQAIVRMTEPQALYEEICRICVSSGRASMAWIGLVDGQRLRPVAWGGRAKAYTAKLHVRWDPQTPADRGPSAAELSRGRRYVCNDVLADKSALVSPELARGFGVRAVAAFPFSRGGAIVGVLNLYVGEADFFDGPLVALLDEMVADISFALDNFDREAARVKALAQAQAGFERFARLFHSAPVSTVILSADDLRIIDANDAFCERYGVMRSQALGRVPAELGIGPVEGDREAFHDLLRTQRHVRNFIGRVRVRSGELRDALFNGELIDYQGQPCMLSMSLDLGDVRRTEQARQAVAAAEAANRAKTEFLSRMSHELRTPLNAVLGFSQLLLHDEARARLKPHELQQLEHIEQAGWHLLTLIDDVLDVARIEAGQMRVDAHHLELIPLLEEALRMSEPLARRLGVVLGAGYRNGPRLGVLADATRLRQVMLNLLSNGIKYNRPGGSVHVKVQQRGDQVLIDVVDTGLGMTQEQLQRLYEPFNRLGRERGGIEGTGIGLVLVRQLMRLMHGELVIDSEIGQGTRARLVLPHSEPPEESPFTVAGALDMAEEGTAPRGVVLYVEDNAVNAMLVEQLLARWPDVRFVQAEDGGSGLELARRLLPDLLLLDMQLPDMDGIDVLRRLRADEATRDLCIISLSASAMPEEIERARCCGADAYWTKPLDFDRFLSDVAQLLGPKGRHADPRQLAADFEGLRHEPGEPGSRAGL